MNSRLQSLCNELTPAMQNLLTGPQTVTDVSN